MATNVVFLVVLVAVVRKKNNVRSHWGPLSGSNNGALLVTVAVRGGGLTIS